MSENNSKNNTKNNILDVDEKSFQNTVIEASDKKLVLADFWAPWCEPCKQLTPILLNIAQENIEKITLVKINIDENQQLAAQLRIQSIPTVFAFYKKQIVDAFQGVLTKDKIIQFIEKILGESLSEDFTEYFEKIADLINKEKIEDAKLSLEEFLVDHSDNVLGISNYIDCLSKLSSFEEAENFIQGLEDKIKKDLKIISSITKLDLNKNKNTGPSIEELLINYGKNPKSIDIALSLSEKYFAEEKFNEAFDLLIKEYIKYKNNKQNQIKQTLLKFFEALGNENEYTKIYRKKFSSIMFS